MKLPHSTISETADATRALGRALGETLGPGAVVACVGPLGAGKTCFLQGLAEGLGVRTPVTSPTFVLVNEYRGRMPVYHLDAYRLDTLAALIDIGVEEMLHGEGVAMVEWADKLYPLLPPGTITVTLDGAGDEPRRIAIDVR